MVEIEVVEKRDGWRARVPEWTPAHSHGGALLTAEIVESILALLVQAAGARGAAVTWRGEPTSSVLAGEGWLDADGADADWALVGRVLPDGVADLGGDRHATPLVSQGHLVGMLTTFGADGEAGAAALSCAARHVDVLLAHEWPDIAHLPAWHALFEIGQKLSADDVGYSHVLDLVVERARELCACDLAWIGLVDDTESRVSLAAASGAATQALLAMQVDVGAGIGGAAVERGRSMLVRDVDAFDGDWPREVVDALRGEGVRSILGYPMFCGRTVGVLYLASRAPTDFSHVTATLPAAFASQAAIVVEKARLLGSVADQNALFERSADIHRRLTDIALAGGGVHDLVDELTMLLGCDVHLELLPSSVPDGGDDVTMTPASTSVPVIAGDERLGTLRTSRSCAETPLHLRALEHGATVVALELLRERAAAQAEARMQGELLEALLQDDARRSESIRRRAALAGLDLDRARSLVAVRPARECDRDYIAQLGRSTPGVSSSAEPMLTAMREGAVIFAVPPDADASALARSVHERTQRGGIDCHIGVSDPQIDLGTALREAQACLRLAASGRAVHTVMSCADLGPLRFLLDAPSAEHMCTFVRGVLGPVADHDREASRTDLLGTLRAYVESDGHQARIADACHIHISTVKYRMGRIADVLGRAPSNPEVRYEIRLAFGVLDTLQRLGIDPLDPA